MLKAEAIWLEEVLAGYDADALSPMLNIGSSTLDYRSRKAPHIDTHIFAPLSARDIPVRHVDIREGEGIDIRADILDDQDFKRLSELKSRFVLCCNVLEHVTDPALFAQRCYGILPPGGRLLISVPHSYPYHRDPIDTMFRPKPEEILDLLDTRYDVERAEIFETGSYRDNLRRRPWIITRQLRLFFPFFGLNKWRRSVAKFYWMVNPYLQSAVIIRKPLSDGS